MEEPTSHLDATDEFPAPAREAGSTRHGNPAQLDACLAALSEALDRAEYRWQELEQRLQSQDQSIAQLEAIARQPEPPRLTEIVAGSSSDAAEPVSAVSQAAERAFQSRIAELESYITGRADYWKAMEDEIETRARRIAELETELSQRIEREERLNSQLHAESSRANHLRDELAELRNRMEDRQRDR